LDRETRARSRGAAARLTEPTSIRTARIAAPGSGSSRSEL
jgi:hypothetical protein